MEVLPFEVFKEGESSPRRVPWGYVVLVEARAISKDLDSLGYRGATGWRGRRSSKLTHVCPPFLRCFREGFARKGCVLNFGKLIEGESKENQGGGQETWEATALS